jgi:signal recognition particle subunit SRP72
MADDTNAKVQKLFTELERLCQQEEYKKILLTCDKILKLIPNDADALKAKVITHIHLGEYQKAIDAIEKADKPSSLLFELSYSCYRSDKLEEALEQVSNLLDDDSIDEDLKNQCLQLKAQILYRMEKHYDALQIYQDILKNTDEEDPYYEEILSNYYAVKSAFKNYDSITIIDDDVKENSTSTYELAYNSACILIAEEQYDEAEKLLETAKSICREALLEEDYAEVEIEEELSIIIVQLAYVKQLKGDTKQANDLYQSVLKLKSADEVVSAIALNNVIAIRKENEIMDSSKKYRTVSSPALNNKLTTAQKKSIEINGVLLSLYMNKYPAAIEQANILMEKYPEEEVLKLIKPAILYRQKNTSEALKELEKHFKDNKTFLKLCLSIAQFKIMEEKYEDALKTIETYIKCSNTDVNEYPGLLSLVLWLNEKCGNIEKSLDLLQTYIDKNNDNENQALVKKLIDFKLHCNNPEEAAKDYEKLVKADPTNVQAISGLVIALSKFDIQKAEEYEQFLQTDHLNELVKSLNIDNLESSYASTKTYKKMVNQSIANNEKPRVKKPRKRKPFVPKNFIPNFKPDPERWLPKYERSNYKNKRKNLNKGPQGASIAGGGIGGTRSANIGGGKFVPLVEKVEKPESPVEEEKKTPPKQAPKKKQQKKKKGKGRK